MLKRNKKSKEEGAVKRIINLDVHEPSVVDKPAINEEFIIVKSIKGEKPMTITKQIIEKATHWNSKTDEAAVQKRTHCVFCKEDGGREPKIGLKCSVCFSCAVEREKNGVFEQCLAGTFNFEEYTKEFETKSDNTSEPGKKQTENEDDEGDEKPAKSPPADDEDDEDGESEEEGDEESKFNKAQAIQLKTRVDKIEKQFSELKTILEQSLTLHDEAARALNQIVELQMMALEQVSVLAGQEDPGADSSTEAPGQDQNLLQNAAFSELGKKLKSVKADVSKAGAKISGARLQVLREISEKLSELIRSVVDVKTEAKKKSASRIMNFESLVETLKTETLSKVESLSKRLNDLENTAGISGAIDDDDGDVSGPSSQDTKKSIFAPLIGLDEIKMQIDKRESYLNRDKVSVSR